MNAVIRTIAVAVFLNLFMPSISPAWDPDQHLDLGGQDDLVKDFVVIGNSVIILWLTDEARDGSDTSCNNVAALFDAITDQIPYIVLGDKDWVPDYSGMKIITKDVARYMADRSETLPPPRIEPFHKLADQTDCCPDEFLSQDEWYFGVYQPTR